MIISKGFYDITYRGRSFVPNLQKVGQKCMVLNIIIFLKIKINIFLFTGSKMYQKFLFAFTGFENDPQNPMDGRRNRVCAEQMKDPLQKEQMAEKEPNFHANLLLCFVHNVIKEASYLKKKSTEIDI